jgi:5-formyltetrahydrofolate cyclo-ligase
MGPPSVDDQAAKSELRAVMRSVRRSIAADPEARARRSDIINDRLIAAISKRTSDHHRIRRLMAYEPLPGEPDLDRLVAWASAEGVDVFVPAVDGPDLRVDPGGVDPKTLDVVVVPGLAFTVDGHRLGQGGGHFDRFLPRLSPSCLKAGVAFREQLVDVVPTEPHDVVLDVVITDA